MSLLVVPSDVASPSSLTISILRPPLAVDLTDVTAVSLSVLRRDGTTTTYACNILSATASEIILQHVFQPGDITSTGLYYLAPRLSVPGGTIAAETVPMMVSTPFATNPLYETSAWLATTSGSPGAGNVFNSWMPVTSPYVASPAAPWLLLDLRTAGTTVTLWSGVDGEEVHLVDTYSNGATHPLTLNATATQLVPAPAGSYGASASWNTSGFTLNLKYSAALTAWVRF